MFISFYDLMVWLRILWVWNFIVWNIGCWCWWWCWWLWCGFFWLMMVGCFMLCCLRRRMVFWNLRRDVRVCWFILFRFLVDLISLWFIIWVIGFILMCCFLKMLVNLCLMVFGFILMLLCLFWLRWYWIFMLVRWLGLVGVGWCWRLLCVGWWVVLMRLCWMGCVCIMIILKVIVCSFISRSWWCWFWCVVMMFVFKLRLGLFFLCFWLNLRLVMM